MLPLTTELQDHKENVVHNPPVSPTADSLYRVNMSNSNIPRTDHQQNMKIKCSVAIQSNYRKTHILHLVE